MRAQAKRVQHEEEEESAFVSMTDMTVGFLFIMMILLAFFASQIMDSEAVPKAEFDAMVAERDAWRALAEDRAATIVLLEQQRDALVRRVAELEQERDRLRVDAEDAAAIAKSLDAALEQLRLERDALLQWIAELEQEREELLAKTARLEVDLAAASERIAELERLVERLRAEVREKDREIAALRARIAQLTAIDPLEAYLAQVARARRDVLVRLRDAIRADFPDLEVDLSEESDALRFRGEGLFATNSSGLARDKRAIVARLGQRLDEVLPCYTIGEASLFDQSCNPGFVMIEAVQIEGHTDDTGGDFRNWNLAADRSISTFFAMREAAPGLARHENLKGQPVLSVAAYGPDRPVAGNDDAVGRSTNRRIDLRFIMVTPRDTEGIAVIRDALRSADLLP